jgi:hypothetical protein
LELFFFLLLIIIFVVVEQFSAFETEIESNT